MAIKIEKVMMERTSPKSFQIGNSNLFFVRVWKTEEFRLIKVDFGRC